MAMAMLLKEIKHKDYEQGKEKYRNHLIQEKHNGVRAMLHIKKEVVVGIRDRRNSPVLHLYPELKALKFKGVEEAIIDGEIVVFNSQRKSVFYGGINQRSRAVKSEKVRKAFPVTFVAFDILVLNGEALVSKGYKDRYDLIPCVDTEHYDKIKNEGHNFWEKVITDNREGMVLKNPNGIYEMDKRSSECIKVKNYKVANVIVTKTEANPKGTKIYGYCDIDGMKTDVECQRGSDFQVKEGDMVEVVYLDIYNNKLIQPHKAGVKT